MRAGLLIAPILVFASSLAWAESGRGDRRGEQMAEYRRQGEVLEGQLEAATSQRKAAAAEVAGKCPAETRKLVTGFNWKGRESNARRTLALSYLNDSKYPECRAKIADYDARWTEEGNLSLRLRLYYKAGSGRSLPAELHQAVLTTPDSTGPAL